MKGEIRGAEIAIQGLETAEMPGVKDYPLFHNNMRPRMSLYEMVSPEVAGIKVEGSDKWPTIIQNAAMKRGKNYA
jgi:hypothetical protein